MSYSKGDILKMLPCEHEFHSTCVDQWLNIHRTCPFCRHDVTNHPGDLEEAKEEDGRPEIDAAFPGTVMDVRQGNIIIHENVDMRGSQRVVGGPQIIVDLGGTNVGVAGARGGDVSVGVSLTGNVDDDNLERVMEHQRNRPLNRDEIQW